MSIENAEKKPAEPQVSPDFCSPQSDIILVSSDGVEFQVFSRILIEASPIFRDMVSLPKTSQYQSKSERVPLEESTEMLDQVLRFIYPIPEPFVSSLDSLKGLLKVADKYLLEGMTQSLRRILISAVAETEPLRAYAIACMYGFETEAKAISRLCLKIDILQDAELYEELAMISGRDLLRLIKLHQSRATSILSILNTAGPSACTGSGATPGVPLWWNEFKLRAKEEIRIRPLGDTIFHPKFLAACVNVAVNAGCPQCPINYLSNATQARLDQLKERIDGLLDTV